MAPRKKTQKALDVKIISRPKSEEFKKVKKEAKERKKLLKKRSSRKPEAPSAYIRIRNAPYGFFEEAVQKYFSQYGTVRRVRVMRNKKGGFSRTIYVGFRYAEVAAIVTTVLHKSLMMGENLISCKQLKQKEVPPWLRYGKMFGKKPVSKTSYLKKKIHLAYLQRFKENPQMIADILNRKLAKAKELGIDYAFDFSEKLAAALEEQQKREEKTDKQIGKFLENCKD